MLTAMAQRVNDMEVVKAYLTNSHFVSSHCNKVTTLVKVTKLVKFTFFQLNCTKECFVMVKQQSSTKLISQKGLINLLNVIVGHFDNFDHFCLMQYVTTLFELVTQIIVSFMNIYITKKLTDKSNFYQLNSNICSISSVNNQLEKHLN